MIIGDEFCVDEPCSDSCDYRRIVTSIRGECCAALLDVGRGR